MKPPRGRPGRPSKSFTLEQAKALLASVERTRWHAYVALSLLVGICTEEARALRWAHVVTWLDDAVGWQPVTTAGFDAARAGDDSYAITSGAPSGIAVIPRPRSHAERWRFRSDASRRCGNTISFRSGTG